MAQPNEAFELIKKTRRELIQSKGQKPSNVFVEPGCKSVDEATHRHPTTPNGRPSSNGSFDLDSLKQEMRERYSNQLLRDEQIAQILLSSSEDANEEKPPRVLAIDTQPDSMFPHEDVGEPQGLLHFFLCCCCKLCTVDTE